MAERYLIVGLGNPGVKYANTRHNIGFRCVDALAERHGLSFDRKQGKALIASGTIVGQPVLLIKPQTYMNLSGDAVSAVANFYRITPDRLLVIFDDLDLPVGTVRIRKSGGAGGHKGMISIIERLGTQEFSRIRVGIGRPSGRMDPADYVLLPFREGDESILVAETIDRVAQAVQSWLADGIEITMNRYNHNVGHKAQRQRAAAQSSPDDPSPASDKGSVAPASNASTTDHALQEDSKSS
ncbi:MAG: aminoacyl-tRNA hydrolase [Anaerolineae bacterium]|nr:aminoacyl-tRNA hydrolase [Anaerolineae bacterium]